MKILAVDTALGACSAAMLEDGRVRARRFELMARGHAEALAPMVEAVMGEAGLDFPALDRLAVTIGPGTFTGQRVGLAFMRGLRVALKKPLAGVTTLAAMGAEAIAETGAPAAAAVHDARRGEVYFELMTSDGKTLHPASVLSFEDALAVLRNHPGHVALAGTAAARLAELLQVEGRAVPTGITAPDAAWVARLGLVAPVPDAPPAPLYLRAPDAKFPLRRFDPLRDQPATLAALHAAAFDKGWEAGAIAALLAAPGAFALTAQGGFILARVAGGEAEILTLAVAPHARRRGLGRALLAAAAETARAGGAEALFLEVGAANPAALALYSAMGFAPVGKRKAYYGGGRALDDSGGDALILKAGLPLAGAVKS